MLKRFGNQVWLKCLRLTALAAICVSLASADVLYWIDLSLGTDVIPGGIALAGFTGVAATDSVDFDTKLTTGTWDAVIIAIQNTTFSSFGLLTDLTNYVNSGGKLIGTDWDGDPSFYGLFDAAGVDTNNSSVTNDGSALFNAIAGNISLTNPGWGIFDNSFSPLAGGIGIGPSGGGFGIIQGNGGRTFLNGPLFDTYTDVSQGQQLVANELTGDVIEAPVPEPATFALLLGACGGLMLLRKKQIS